MRTLAFPKTHEGADIAQFIRCVVLPSSVAVAARVALAPVTFERRAQACRGQQGPCLSRIQRDGGRSGIEVAAVGRTRDVVDAVACRGNSDRSDEIARELVAPAFPLTRLVVMAERAGDDDCILVASQRPEVVPVRAGWLVVVTLVTDRRWHQSEACSALA